MMIPRTTLPFQSFPVVAGKADADAAAAAEAGAAEAVDVAAAVEPFLSYDRAVAKRLDYGSHRQGGYDYDYYVYLYLL